MGPSRPTVLSNLARRVGEPPHVPVAWAFPRRVPGAGLKHPCVLRIRDEWEMHFEQTRDRMGLRAQDRSAESGKPARSCRALVVLSTLSPVACVPAGTGRVEGGFAFPLVVLERTHDVRWCGCPDGTSHMDSFLTSQVRACEAFGVGVPRERLSVTERGRADAGRRGP